MRVQDIDIYEEDGLDGASSVTTNLQRWVLALLLASTKLTSLSMQADGVPWLPVLGQLRIRHLELTMRYVRPWLDVITADLSYCSCLETLKIEADRINSNSMSMKLPDLLLHEVTTLRSLELIGWYPKGRFTLPPGCVLRLLAVLDTPAQWEQLQAKGCPMSMLYLSCMKLQAWTKGVPRMSGLQFLKLHCTRMQDQDLAALQHIPHLCLGFTKFSTFRVTSGSWQSFQIRGKGGFSINFSNADAFVRGTGRFFLECSGHETDQMYRVLRAACMRKGVEYYECEHHKRLKGHPDSIITSSFNNVELCKAARTRSGAMLGHHEQIMCTDEFWPSRAAYPEL